MDPNSAQTFIANPLPNKAKFFGKGPARILFLILGVVIIVELVLSFNSFRKAGNPFKKVAPDASLSLASITLASAKTTYKPAETIPMFVNIYTGGHPVDGADAIIKYDPLILEATDKSLEKGTIFAEYPLLKVDASQGLIQVSGVSGVNTTFNGMGYLAIVNFKAKKTGKTKVSVMFNKDSTTDSNITETKTGTDLLDKVTNLDLEVK